MIRWGILGAGMVADGFARDLVGVEGAEFSAVASRRRESAETLGGRYGAARVHDSPDDLFADPDVDVVYIATPNDRHAPDAIACLENGKAVLCEKPFALDTVEAKQVIDVARSRSLFCMEGMWMRFVPAIKAVVELVEQGAIGDVRMIQADFSGPAPVVPTSRLYSPERGGGALLDLGVYTLSLAQMLLGEPDEVSGRLDIGSTGVDEHATALLAYKGGATAVLTSSIRTWGPNQAVISGTTGTIRIPGPICVPDRYIRSLTSTEPPPAPPITPPSAPGDPSVADRAREFVRSQPYLSRAARGVKKGYAIVARGDGRSTRVPFAGTGYRYEAEEVVRCLREGLTESPTMPLTDTIAVMELMDALRA